MTLTMLPDLILEPRDVAALALAELDRMLAGYAHCELARAVSLEGGYQGDGARVSRRTYYEQIMFGWWLDWPR